MDEDRLRELYSKLDATIREIVDFEYQAPTGDGHLEDSHRMMVVEWVVSVGVLEFCSDNPRPRDEVSILAPEDLPLWRAKGLVSSVQNKLNTIESHNVLVDMHMGMDGEDEE